jgi:hypothetical protein
MKASFPGQIGAGPSLLSVIGHGGWHFSFITYLYFIIYRPASLMAKPASCKQAMRTRLGPEAGAVGRFG